MFLYIFLVVLSFGLDIKLNGFNIQRIGEEKYITLSDIIDFIVYNISLIRLFTILILLTLYLISKTENVKFKI